MLRWADLAKGEKRLGPSGCSYGIATGERSGFWVLDLDTPEAIAWYARTIGVDTLAVRTRRGVHLYFAMPGGPVRNSASRLFPGVDVRGDGGFVVAPGFPHRTGFVYSIARDVPIAPTPEALLQELRRLPARPETEGEVEPVDPESAEGRRREKLAQEFLAQAPASVEGQGGSAKLWHVAMYLMRTLELRIDVAADLIGEGYNGRCVPPWSDKEIYHKLENARDSGTWDTGIASETLVQDLAAAAQAPVALSVKPTRRQKSKEHVYRCRPGDVPNGEKAKISFGQAVAMLVSHPDWCGVLQWDEFRQKVLAIDPPIELDAENGGGLTTADGEKIALWFEVCNQYTLSDVIAYKAAGLAARACSFHPVKEYLAGVQPGASPILPTLAARALGNSDPLAQTFLTKTLVAAVRRILHPGCQVDTVLVLMGHQGARKSSFIRALFGEDVTKSQMPDLGSKDASSGLRGFWAVELGEMDRILRTESSTSKEFISRAYDDYRPAYGRDEIRVARSSIMIGSTNEDQILEDSTGGRRYWPFKVGARVELEYIRKHRDQIWAEVMALAATDYPHWFEDETEADPARVDVVKVDAWHDAIEDHVTGREWVGTCTAIYLAAVAKGDEGALARAGRRETLRVADVLRRLGCSPLVREEGGKRVKGWKVPPSLAGRIASSGEEARRAAERASLALGVN